MPPIQIHTIIRRGLLVGLAGSLPWAIQTGAIVQGPRGSHPDALAADSLPLAGPAPISADVAEAQGWRVETVVSGLSHPWSVVWLPDGSALVSERAGRLRVIDKGKLDPMPISGLPTVLVEGQGGLLDLALHPNYAENHWLYMTLAIGSPQANRTALAAAITAAADPDGLAAAGTQEQTNTGAHRRLPPLRVEVFSQASDTASGPCHARLGARSR